VSSQNSCDDSITESCRSVNEFPDRYRGVTVMAGLREVVER
jgi:hypothetical protein